MFDWSWIDDLDGNAAADHLARSRDRVIAAEAEQFFLAAHWADLHVPDFVHGWTEVLPGQERVVSLGDGCPEIDEFAGAELAALLGRSTAAGEQLIAHAVQVRHRHPLLWAGIARGEVRVWLASKVATRCSAAHLTRDQAAWVDAETTPYLATLPFTRFFQLLEAKIIEADPEAAEARAEAMALARFVRAGATDEAGMRTLVARAHAGDVTYLVAVIDRIATILDAQGDGDPVEVRRAKALRILANPARALALLVGVELAALASDDDQALDPVRDNSEESITWMSDARGRPLRGAWERGDLVDGPGDDAALFELGAQAEVLVIGSTEPTSDEGLGDPGELRRLVEALERFDAGALDPLTVFHVHVAQESLEPGATGVARVEDLGPTTLGALRAWLADPVAAHRVTLRPVLDARDVVPVDRYEIPAKMKELVAIREPFEVFPFGTLASREADTDHVVPHRRRGRTAPDNLAGLGRKHHRLKTFGGWVVRQPVRGHYWWRTPHGHWFVVNPSGSYHHGRDPALDELLLRE